MQMTSFKGSRYIILFQGTRSPRAEASMEPCVPTKGRSCTGGCRKSWLRRLIQEADSVLRFCVKQPSKRRSLAVVGTDSRGAHREEAWTAVLRKAFLWQLPQPCCARSSMRKWVCYCVTDCGLCPFFRNQVVESPRNVIYLMFISFPL